MLILPFISYLLMKNSYTIMRRPPNSLLIEVFWPICLIPVRWPTQLKKPVSQGESQEANTNAKPRTIGQIPINNTREGRVILQVGEQTSRKKC
jgi:hypothetical protein